MSALKLEILEQDGINILSISGAVDSETIQEFKSSLSLLTKMAVSRIVLDLKGLTYINSSAFGSMVKFYNSSLAQRHHVVICNQTRRIEKSLALLGLQQEIPAFDSREKAIEALSSQR